MNARVLQFLISRAFGRFIATGAAVLTLGRIPPFASTSALIVRGDEVLTIFDPARREHVLPGGHLKWRETPEQAVVRELAEETGYRIKPVRLLGVFSGREQAGEWGVVRIVFSARIVGGSLASSWEGEATWIPSAQLADSDSRDSFLMRLPLAARPPDPA